MFMPASALNHEWQRWEKQSSHIVLKAIKKTKP
jgi:hypothetical protein